MPYYVATSEDSHRLGMGLIEAKTGGLVDGGPNKRLIARLPGVREAVTACGPDIACLAAPERESALL